MSSAYCYFYGDSEVQSEIEDVEEIILNGGMDNDGITSCMWIKELKSEDLPAELFRIILKNKHDPAFKEIYQCLRDHIGGYMDKV